MSYAKINDLWEDLAEALVLDQYKDSERLKALVKLFVQAGQSIEDAADRLKRFYNVDEATGVVLDLIGALRNIPRNGGESDSEYRERIKAEFGVMTAGTPKFVMSQAAKRSGDPSPVILEEDTDAPVVLIYTPNGRQLTRGYANSLTPVGVLGAPAAALVIGNDNRRPLVGANGKKIVGVSQDGYDDGIRTGYILDDQGRNIVDDQGNKLIYESHLW